MIRLLGHQTRYELLTFSRNRQARFFTVLLPVIFLVIFVSVFGNQLVGPQHIKASTYYVPGIAALAVLTASFTNLVISITAQRELGVLKRRRATPVPAWVLVAGRALTSLVVSLFVTSVVIAIGNLAYGVHIAPGALGGLTISVAVGSLAFACLGYAVSTAISSADAAQPIVLAITLPLSFISGVYIPSVRLPSGLQQVAEVFPLQHLVAAMGRGFLPGSTGVAWGDLAIVAVWGFAGFALALNRFRWTPAAAQLETKPTDKESTMAMIENETRTRQAQCPTHGDVRAEKKVPKIKFPFLITAPARGLAALRPYRCPACGAKAT